MLGASIALVASQGASGAPLGVLQRPMLDELGWSSTQYSLSATLSSLLGGVDVSYTHLTLPTNA